MMRHIVLLFLVSLTLCGLTSCKTRLRRTYEGSTVMLHLRNDEDLPDDAVLDVYVDDCYVSQIVDHKNPGKMTLLRGLHSFRVVSEKHNIEGTSQIFILGSGNAQTLRIDLIKTPK